MTILLLILIALFIIKILKHMIRSYIFRFVIFFVIGTGLFGSLGASGLFFNVLRIANFTSMMNHFIH